MEIMSKRPFFGAFCFAMLLSSSTWAATLEPGQGNLSINEGQGFQPVNGRIDANVGDSVMVSPGGGATVVYADGCKVNVQPGAVTTIAPLSPCASGSNAQECCDWGGLVIGGAAVGLLGLGIYEAAKTPTTTTPTPISP
jgi:hypothetical protein